MPKTLTEKDRNWYYSAVENIASDAVTVNRSDGVITYHGDIYSDESHSKNADPEELSHAVLLSLLASETYGYKKQNLGHEVHYAHGSKGSKADEVDIVIWDEDRLPFALIELKSSQEFDAERNDAIKYQLFGTAPLAGAPKLLIYATVHPKGAAPQATAVCIDYTKHKSYDAWREAGEPHSTEIPVDYRDLSFKPFKNDSDNDLDLNSTPADFRAIATTFHNEFFGEHPDNTLFGNLVKCLLAKIHDERTCKKGSEYQFQVLYKNGKPEAAFEVFSRVNELYKNAYTRYVDSHADEVDEINPKEFSEESVKSVVQALQGVSITKGAAKHGDIIGAFFEEILRSGFKQDRGMYFTHDNIVRFMIEVLDIDSLTRQIWKKSNHPENRLPYIIDPACGSGTFLLHAMSLITDTVKENTSDFVSDHDSEQFFNARLSDEQPNYWAENFVYGFDPKFIMAITAKVNMVLHGDGSAHIFKEDAFKPFSTYSDLRLRPLSDAMRSVPRASYAPELCEQFDVIVSNPPFGITLSAEARTNLGTTFSLPESTPSEGLFIERCFQLLRPGGRLGIVLPESLLNAKEMIAVRLLFYRFFHIRAIVSMPRNIFIDTPTLTSLVFAEKKSKADISAWDAAWNKYAGGVDKAVRKASQALSRANLAGKSAEDIATEFLTPLNGIVSGSEWISKGGKAPSLMKFMRDWTGSSAEDAASFYRDVLRTAGFRNICQHFIFKQISDELNYEFSAFEVDEVGYKLSKRREKARVNQLCSFVSRKNAEIIPNLHLSDAEYLVDIDTSNPKSVLDFIRRDVVWGAV